MIEAVDPVGQERFMQEIEISSKYLRNSERPVLSVSRPHSGTRRCG